MNNINNNDINEMGSEQLVILAAILVEYFWGWYSMLGFVLCFGAWFCTL